MINLDFLEYLTEYAKTENLSKASKSLSLSQSALTRAMQKVEEYIGVPLFERTKNKLSLNETGKELVKNARLVIEAEKTMRERTIAFYNLSTSISVGTVAPGPMIKYGHRLFSIFPNKNIASKIDTEQNLLDGLRNGLFDFIFITNPIESEELECDFAFEEMLYVSVPKEHFLAGMKEGVCFAEIDGQSFLVAENLGVWDNVTKKFLPKSRFFPQSMENLSEIVNASTIPTFSTNLTLSLRESMGRVNLPILDKEAKFDFYVVYLKQNKKKIKDFLKIIKN